VLRYTLRLIGAGLSSRWRPRIGALEANRTAHRAWLADCDPNFHMTEGGYLVVAGLARLSLWWRMGVFDGWLAHRIRPAAVSTAVTFFREIRPYRRFDIVSRLITWDDRYTFFEHRFERDGRDAARVVVRNVFRDRTGVVRPAALLARLGHAGAAPEMPAELTHWAAMREAARAPDPVRPG